MENIMQRRISNFTSQELVDVKTLASGTTEYNYFPSTLTTGKADINYQRMPFPYTQVNIHGMRCSLSVAQRTPAQIAEYFAARVEILKDSIVWYRGNLATLLGLSAVASHTAGTDHVYIADGRFTGLKRPIPVKNSESLYVKVVFTACTQTIDLKFHLSVGVQDNLIKNSL